TGHEFPPIPAERVVRKSNRSADLRASRHGACVEYLGPGVCGDPAARPARFEVLSEEGERRDRMRSLVLSLVLGTLALGVVALTPSQSQAQWMYPGYRGYYYSPGYASYSYYPGYSSYSYYPSYSYAYPSYRSYYPSYSYAYPSYSYSYAYPSYSYSYA